MKVLLHSIMIFFGTMIAAALVALGEPGPLVLDASWLLPLGPR